jgi:two-component system response regulator QseB
MKLLLVEDNTLLGDGIRKALKQEGFSVDWVKTKADALLAKETNLYDVLILDISLPDGTGLEILHQLRAAGIQTPVLILTALSATTDRVRGLNLGADDYLTKPFEIDELNARIRALHRRSQGVATPTITLHSVRLDPAAHTVTKCGEKVELGAKEFAILQTLFERAGRVVTKADLEESLYGWGEEISSNAVEVLVHRLRKKLGNEVVKTIRGVGYITSPEKKSEKEEKESKNE